MRNTLITVDSEWASRSVPPSVEFGGFGAGAIRVGCEVAMGVEMDDTVLRPFADPQT